MPQTVWRYHVPCLISIEKKEYTNIVIRRIHGLEIYENFRFRFREHLSRTGFYADSKSAIRFEISLSVQLVMLTDKSTQICRVDFYYENWDFWKEAYVFIEFFIALLMPQTVWRYHVPFNFNRKKRYIPTYRFKDRTYLNGLENIWKFSISVPRALV